MRSNLVFDLLWTMVVSVDLAVVETTSTYARRRSSSVGIEGRYTPSDAGPGGAAFVGLVLVGLVVAALGFFVPAFLAPFFVLGFFFVLDFFELAFFGVFHCTPSGTCQISMRWRRTVTRVASSVQRKHLGRRLDQERSKMT